MNRNLRIFLKFLKIMKNKKTKNNNIYILKINLYKMKKTYIVFIRLNMNFKANSLMMRAIIIINKLNNSNRNCHNLIFQINLLIRAKMS